MLSSILFFFGMIHYHFWVNPYSVFDLAEASLTAFLLISGMVACGEALRVGGKGGPIQSIDSLKSLITVSLYCLI
jgi:hypothetical protein